MDNCCSRVGSLSQKHAPGFSEPGRASCDRQMEGGYRVESGGGGAYRIFGCNFLFAFFVVGKY